MTPINIQNLLVQIDDTRERLLIAWGRASASLAAETVAEIEGLGREFGLLTKLHLHAVADGTVPASLLVILAEIQEAAEMRSAASEATSALLSPSLNLNAIQPPASVRDEPFRLEGQAPSPLPPSGEVF